ncbi:glycoside hydrolase family 79 protein, partial [Rickenella mellea]
MNPSLVSFSIEQDRWTDWVGTTSSNTFFFNTLDNLRRLTGQPPGIRIGANSEDHTNFNPNVQFSQAIFPAFTAQTPYPEASSIVVGNQYYQIASHLPPGTHVTWGVNFGQNNLTAAFLEAQSIKNAFASSAVKNAGITLDFIEIGNEADLYAHANNGARNPSTWSISEYTKEWTNFAKNVSVAAGITSSSHVKFLGGSFGFSGHSSSSFSPQGMFASGILNSPQGQLITTISQHHYSGSFCTGSNGLLQDLMTKATIRSNLTQFSSDIAATHAQGLGYILGETNSYSCHGAPGVSNTAGAGLWTLDYLLFASQIGISQLFFHEGIGFKYNLIQPLTLNHSTLDGHTLNPPLAPHVQPQYYAAVIAGEAIGTSGSTRAVELSIGDARVTGYAFYEGNTLKRVVLVNLRAFLTTDTGGRPFKTITIGFTGSGSKPTTMTLKRLAIGHADDGHGLTWGGQSYETGDARPTGAISVQTLSVNTSFQLSSTEAVMLSFN